MHKLIQCFSIIFFITCIHSSILSQEDSLSFIKSKKIPDEDLLKKKEGTFFTGLPDISSDPITGFGFGIRSNIYWNGERDDPFFAYTPYLAKLKLNAAYYTSNARELIVALDLPYFQGTRWRYKIDFKAQQNPANLYFGLTEETLGRLRVNTSSSQSFSTFEEYEKSINSTRAGELNEESTVTDVLINRFRETEYMLNLKADYVLFDGKWRIMGGYEIQHLKYATFEGVQSEAIDPNTGQNIRVANGTSLLRKDFEQGKISGYNGGWVSLIQTALIYDTRDFEPDPSSGYYFEIANEFSNTLIGSEFNFDKLFIQGRFYEKIPIGLKTVVAGRIGIGNIFGSEAPFFEYQDQWSPDGSINALGGRQSLRGYRSNRFLSRSMWFANVELRTKIFDFTASNQLFAFTIAPFVDAGTTRNRWQDLNFSNTMVSFGSGLRIAWNQSTILSFDYGISSEDRLFYFGIGQIF